MITEQDLQEAIAECEGQRNPNANTCIKLAAFYIIKDHLFPDIKQEYVVPEYRPAYTAIGENTPETIINYDSGSEFSRLINGRNSDEIWDIIDELMETLEVIYPRLYDGVIRKLNN